MLSNIYWSVLAAATPDELWRVVDAELEQRHQTSYRTPLTSSKQRWVLYGAGRFGKQVLKALFARGIKPIYAVDSDNRKWGTFIYDVPICRPDQLLSEKKDCIVVVAAMATHAIEEYLDNIGLPFIFSERDGSLGPIPGHKLAERRTDFSLIFSALADDHSRETLLAVAKARMFQRFNFPMRGNVFTYDISCHPQYFPSDIIKIRDREYFVDCGTFDGDSIISFFSQARLANPRGHFEAIGFEVDPTNAVQTRNSLKKYDLRAVEIINAGLGATEGKMDLSEINTCHADTTQNSKVPITTLDKALAGSFPTFIKMDIEGFEIDALNGANETIRSAAPTLAVCIYHETEHLLDIPLNLLSLNGNSNIYIRHHSAGTLWETVCYRIAK